MGRSIDLEDPLVGIRKKLFRICIKIAGFLFLILEGVWPKYIDMDYDYTEYLGKQYNKEIKREDVSTLISNHVSQIDPVIHLFHRRMPGFAAKSEI